MNEFTYITALFTWQNSIICIAVLLLFIGLGFLYSVPVKRAFKHLREIIKVGVWRWVTSFCTHRIFSRFVPALAVVSAFLFEFHDKIPGADYLYPHTGTAALILFITLAITAFISSFERPADNSEAIKLSQFIAMLSDVVEAKTKRLMSYALPAAVTGATRADCFVDPLEQVRTIFDQGTKFICEQYGLTKKQIDISVLASEAGTTEWNYIYIHQEGWKHIKASTLMAKKHCLAKRSLKTNQQLFVADKELEARRGKYHLSERDIAHKSSGSVFCFPFELKVDDKVWIYVITIVTYDIQLCSQYDTNARETVKIFLEEICRRIKIELINKVIKNTTSVVAFPTNA
tara:strand:+ start:226 stop:1260 length:1035 start_codon:yes stop_codon:yes gene_type:complete